MQKFKAREHYLTALERRVDLWKRGKLMELLKEGETIKNDLKSINTKISIAEISKRFAEHIQKGNVNSAIKLLTSKMQNGILPLNDQTLQQLKQKHPKAAEASKDVLLSDIPEKIHKIRYEVITAESNRRTAIEYGCRWLEEDTNFQQFWFLLNRSLQSNCRSGKDHQLEIRCIKLSGGISGKSTHSAG